MMKRTALDLLRVSWRYLAIVLGGTSLFLIIAPVIGYLPYSDRPGPGWYGLFAGATLEGLGRSFGFVLGWALLAIPYSFFAIVPTYSVVRVSEWAGFPRVLVAGVGALLGGFTTLYFILGMGWYIALDSYTPLVSALLGSLVGAWFVPSPRSALTVRDWSTPRTVGAVATIGLFIWLMFPSPLASLFGLRTDSLTIEGTLSSDGTPVASAKVGKFAHSNSCRGDLVESSTDESGHFHFYREHSQEDFPEDGACKYAVTLCHASDGEWRRLSSASQSGPCGTQARVEFRCDLARTGDIKCDTSFGW
jgi:hypothetical protein